MLVTALGREIKRLRAERGITARGLASAIRKSVAYIAKIEVQGEIPTPDLIYAISQVLEADFLHLLRLAKDTRISTFLRAAEREYSAVLSSYVGMEEFDGVESGKGGVMPATVVSLINMKGGVGKTTLAMQLAHDADLNDLRTLAIDLDPQANLSQALMGPKAYVAHINANKPTVVDVFENLTGNPNNGVGNPLDVSSIIVKQAGYWSPSSLDLIPSRLELSRTLKNSYGKERNLALALSQVSEKYDLVIIDCAPTESVLTDAAYFASRHIIVPIKPEFLAIIGLPLLARSLQEFKFRNADHEIEIAGLVFNHSSNYSSGPEGQKSIEEVTTEAKANGWYICENQVRYSASYAKSAREGTPLRGTSYTRRGVHENFSRLADEIFGLVEVKV